MEDRIIDRYEDNTPGPQLICIEGMHAPYKETITHHAKLYTNTVVQCEIALEITRKPNEITSVVFDRIYNTYGACYKPHQVRYTLHCHTLHRLFASGPH